MASPRLGKRMVNGATRSHPYSLPSQAAGSARAADKRGQRSRQTANGLEDSDAGGLVS